MEERKVKLSTQLAKLNSEILTSDVHNVFAPKRRRISDNLSALKSATAQAQNRRAVSTMVRVPEESTTGNIPRVDVSPSLVIVM